MHNSENDRLQECKNLIEQQDFAAAVDKLQALVAQDPAAENQATLGLAYFHQEQYGLSASAYAAALALDGTRADWRELHDLAGRNELA
ncbi:MAG TPA: hypothetical protein PKB07_15450, partial [Flavilitoribacter sp.]|nr:hypothetical protein [Flavilitoribacter sp.]